MFLEETSVEKNYARFWRIINYYRQNNDIKLELLYNFISIEKRKGKFGVSFFSKK